MWYTPTKGLIDLMDVVRKTPKISFYNGWYPNLCVTSNINVKVVESKPTQVRLQKTNYS